MKKIYFDMDGTIYDLYGIDNWLEMLMNEELVEELLEAKSKEDLLAIDKKYLEN